MSGDLLRLDFELKSTEAEKQQPPDKPAEGKLSKAERLKLLAALVESGDYKPESEKTAEAIVSAAEALDKP